MNLSRNRILGLCTAVCVCASAAAIDFLQPTGAPPSAPVQMTVIPVGTPATARSRWAKLTPSRHSIFSGVASWYGDVFDGHRTANGEIFDQAAMTACHRTLPFGTLVRVINLRNRQSVIVRINDRGVLTPERVIDLSSAAAQKLGMLRRGLAPVRLEIVQEQDPDASTHQPG